MADPRMENTSEANKIQLSEPAAKLVTAQDDDLRQQVVRRPDRQVLKGKGTIRNLLAAARGGLHSQAFLVSLWLLEACQMM